MSEPRELQDSSGRDGRERAPPEGLSMETPKKETAPLAAPGRMDWMWKFVSEPSPRWAAVQIGFGAVRLALLTALVYGVFKVVDQLKSLELVVRLKGE